MPVYPGAFPKSGHLSASRLCLDDAPHARSRRTHACPSTASSGQDRGITVVAAGGGRTVLPVALEAERWQSIRRWQQVVSSVRRQPAAWVATMLAHCNVTHDRALPTLSTMDRSRRSLEIAH